MKLKIFVSLLVFLFALPIIAAPPQQDGKISNGGNSLIVDNTSLIDVNRILMFVTNHGNFGRDLGGTFGYDYGTWYPFTGNLDDYASHSIFGNYSPNYASGLWVGGTDSITGDTLVTISEYSSEYVPGPMDGGTFQPDELGFRVFKLYADSLYDNPNVDYTEYMNDAVPNQFAPVWTFADGDDYIIDGAGDTIIVFIILDTITFAVDTVERGKLGEAQVLGDQFLWSVYNDADLGQHTNMGSDPLGIEVRQSVYGWKADDALGDIVYMRYRIYNKGSRVIENCNFSIWCDPDLGDAGDDFVGCDTLTGLGFVYNDNVTDANYTGQGVPSMGFDFLQGPLVLKSDPSDPDGRMWGQTYPAMTNLGMESFNKYINGTDPDNEIEAYNFMNGLNKSGQTYSYDGNVLSYVLSGDPVTGQGDVDFASSDRRWMQTTGPLTFRPGDSTEIYIAMVMGQSTNNLTSISQMRSNDILAQLTFDNMWRTLDAPAPPVLHSFKDENSVTIAWGDTSEVDPGSYPFEGYMVWQGEDITGPWKKVVALDILNSIKDVYDDKFNPVADATENIKVVSGDNTGLRHSVTLTKDVIEGGTLRNLTEYHYRVEAYTVDNNAPLGFKTLRSSSTVTLIPQMLVQDVTYEYDAVDQIPVAHDAGLSDGVITVVVVNPDSLTGDTYQLTFADTLAIRVDTTEPDPINEPGVLVFDSTNIAWHLFNVTTGDTVLAWQTNQTGDGEYPIINGGFEIIVSGPALGFKSFQVVANGAGVVDPPESAGAPWYGYPVPTDVDPDGYVTGGQQVGEGAWLFATGDNGGSNDGGTRGSYAAFLDRVMRNDNPEDVGIFDFEMRFTGSNDNPGVNGSQGIRWFQDDLSMWVPFELWRTGIGTPDDPSDDVRMTPWVLDFGDDSLYNLESWGDGSFDVDSITDPLNPDTTFYGAGGYEHSVSGGTNDPYTDWVYWVMPADDAAGQSGYLTDEAAIIGGTYAGDGEETMARTVLVNWNGGSAPPFNQDLPELGTVFRLLTGKPNASSDIFSFATSAPGQLTAKSEDMLDAIITVPNPFYLFSGYSETPGQYVVKFHHLPTLCTISIYNLAGELIDTIEKNDASTAIAEWDVLTRNGLPVASGIYVYVVDAPGFGQKVGKMAIMVEQEVLKIY